MALERSWLSVVDVARESLRRLSGSAEVMVRFVKVAGTMRGLMRRTVRVWICVWGPWAFFFCFSFNTASYRSCQQPSVISPTGFLPCKGVIIGIGNWGRWKATEDNIHKVEGYVGLDWDSIKDFCLVMQSALSTKGIKEVCCF